MADDIVQLKDVLNQRKGDLKIGRRGNVDRIDEINKTLDTIEKLRGD